jgi:pimeloyl-ACP methyl ester carboxylesterase
LFLYEHLARVLPPQGIAVLRYDRRPRDGGDVPFAVQAADARAAVDVLRSHVGNVPIGLWGVSQGGWAAPVTAAAYPADIAFIIVVSSCGVSPAAQMRYGTAEQLRRNGYGEEDLRELAHLRATVDDYHRGTGNRATAQALIDQSSQRPWFPLVHIHRELPAEPGTWKDMDFDPEPTFASVSCPVLAFYGETDEWIPIPDSIATWTRAGQAAHNHDITVVELPGCDHIPTLDQQWNLEAISPRYTDTMMTWLNERLSPPHQGHSAE